MEIAPWLAKSKVLTSGKIPHFAKSILENGNLKNEIFKLLKNEKNPELLDPVVHQLFSFYRLDNDLLQRFALEFLPTILCNYFLSIYSKDQKNGASIEALLLGIYNMDAAKSQEEYLIDKMLPSSFLSVSSVYHNPMHADIPSQLTKVTLEKLHGKSINPSCHSLSHVESINNRNRLLIVSHTLMRYNQDIAFYSKFSHLDMCQLCSLLIKSTQDAQRTNSTISSSSSLPVSEELISQLLQAVFFIMYNGLPDEGFKALENLYFRAVYDLLPNSILAISAVHNLLKNQESSGDSSTLNLFLNFSRIPLPPPINKEAITAASFRPHILPEDIDVKDGGGKLASNSTPSGHSAFGGLPSGEEFTMAMKMRQKSVISKVFHIPKKREESEKRDDDKIPASSSLSPPLQSGNLIQFSVAKKALKNPFRSEQVSNATSATSLAKLEFLTKRDTISISPYFSQLDSSETTTNLSIGKSEKKHKSKGGRLKKRHLRRAPSSSSSSSPRHSLSVSSYLSRDVIPERMEMTKSDIDDEDEEEDDEQNEGQDENEEYINECINETEPLLDTKTKTSECDFSVYPNLIGKRQLLLRHITFAAEMNVKESSNDPAEQIRLLPNRCDSVKEEGLRDGSIEESFGKFSSGILLHPRRDSIPRLMNLSSKSLSKDSTREVNKDRNDNDDKGGGDGVAIANNDDDDSFKRSK